MSKDYGELLYFPTSYQGPERGRLRLVRKILNMLLNDSARVREDQLADVPENNYLATPSYIAKNSLTLGKYIIGWFRARRDS